MDGAAHALLPVLLYQLQQLAPLGLSIGHLLVSSLPCGRYARQSLYQVMPKRIIITVYT